MKHEPTHPEPAVYEDWYAEHARFVLGLVGQLGVPQSERADVAQEAWTDVHQSLPLYDPRKGTERAWLGRIAFNAVRDFRRTRRRRPEISLPTGEEPPDPRPAEPETEAGRRRLREALWAFVERAIPNEDQRTAWLLHELEGLTVEEVASATDVKRQTAKSRIEMARTHLRRAAESLSDEERERMRAVILPLGGVDGILRALRESQPPVTDQEVAEVWDRVVERIEASGGGVREPVGSPATAPARPEGYTFTGPGLAATLAGVFLLGAVSGALAHALLTTPTKESTTTIEAEIRPAPPPPTAPTPWITASVAPAPPGAPAALPWESEAWILDHARKAPPAEALRLTDLHLRRFPRSGSAAEREEIAIRALVTQGQRAKAEARAAKLVRWAPYMVPSMEALLGRSIF